MNDWNETYIKIYRKILNHELFLQKPFDPFHAFVWILATARFTPTDIIIKGKVYHLGTGQLLIGSEKLADIFGWSRGKLLRYLELLDELEICTSVGTAHGTLITVENYRKYQIPQTADDTADKTTGGTTHGTHKNKEKESINKDRRTGAEETPCAKPEVISCPDDIKANIERIFGT